MDSDQGDSDKAEENTSMGPQHEGQSTPDPPINPLESGISPLQEGKDRRERSSIQLKTMTASQTSLVQLSSIVSSSPPMTKIRLERPATPAALDSDPGIDDNSDSSPTTANTVLVASKDPDRPALLPPAAPIEADMTQEKDPSLHSGLVSPENPEGGASASSDQGSSIPSLSSDSGASEGEAPEKALTFHHLRNKFMHELEYMLREFLKLERQLLGAKTLTAESAGSRERREKLHSFILHLQETIQQINAGCELEEKASKTTTKNDHEKEQLPADAKEDGESVQKLEEHILSNLLPVKVRLKKQLAAQQGARHNPTNMPVRGVVRSESATETRSTFMPLAEERTSHFGQPVSQGASCLTQKLHGSKLGSASRLHGDGVGHSLKSAPVEGDAADVPPKRKILKAGLALGSSQIESSLTAASNAHGLTIQDPTLQKLSDDLTQAKTPEMGHQLEPEVAPIQTPTKVMEPSKEGQQADHSTPPLQTRIETPAVEETPSGSALLTSTERKRQKKRKRKQKVRQDIEPHFHEQQPKEPQAQQQSWDHETVTSNAAQPKRKKSVVSKKRGPRNVEYSCALCNEVYSSTCDYNPWWALSQHECPKCRKVQIPRVDISAPANAIEYHPALLAHAEDNGNSSPPSPAPSMHIPPSHPKTTFPVATATTGPSEDADLLESDLSDDEDLLSDMESSDSDVSDVEGMESLSPAEQAELERFGPEYKGPVLDEGSASRLLLLMLHASTCPCRHTSATHRDVCRSTKWMMLHVRDCSGTTSTYDVCPFPWCRKVKNLLYHLVSCLAPERCGICSPLGLESSWARLRGLNTFRLQHRTAARAAAKTPGHSERRKQPGLTLSCTPEATAAAAANLLMESSAGRFHVVDSNGVAGEAPTDDGRGPPGERLALREGGYSFDNLVAFALEQADENLELGAEATKLADDSQHRGSVECTTGEGHIIHEEPAPVPSIDQASVSHFYSSMEQEPPYTEGRLDDDRAYPSMSNLVESLANDDDMAEEALMLLRTDSSCRLDAGTHEVGGTLADPCPADHVVSS